MGEPAVKEGSVKFNPLDCEIGDSLLDEVWGYFLKPFELAPSVWASSIFDPLDLNDPLRETHGHLFFVKQSKTIGGEMVHVWTRIAHSKRSHDAPGDNGAADYAEPSEAPKA